MGGNMKSKENPCRLCNAGMCACALNDECTLWYAHCQMCDNSTTWYHSQEEALKAWNSENKPAWEVFDLNTDRCYIAAPVYVDKVFDDLTVTISGNIEPHVKKELTKKLAKLLTDHWV